MHSIIFTLIFVPCCHFLKLTSITIKTIRAVDKGRSPTQSRPTEIIQRDYVKSVDFSGFTLSKTELDTTPEWLLFYKPLESLDSLTA